MGAEKHAVIGAITRARESLARWRPRNASRSRARLAVSVNLASAGVAVALFAAFGLHSDWSDPFLLGALGAIAAIAFLAQVRLELAESSAYLDSSIILALLALAIAGPLPALLVWIAPEAMSRLVFRQDPVLSPGLLGNLTSYALALLAGYGLLRMADPPSLAASAPALYTAGLAMFAVNFAFARLAYGCLYLGHRPSVLIREEFLDLVPLHLALLLLAVATAVLIPVLGVFALLILAAVILLPRLAVEMLTRGRSVAGLAHEQATELYAAAIGDVLGLDRRERRIVTCTAEVLARLEADPTEPRSSDEPDGTWRFDDVHEVVQAALHSTERWDGAGGPAGLRAGLIPYASRVVSVARAWSEMTAAGTLELPQSEAILGLTSRAGTEFDPRVVDAAATVVTEEQAFVRDPSFQPRLHRLPLPRAVRHSRIPAAVARFAQPA